MSIRSISAFNTGVDTNAPLKTLHHSHDAILAQLRELAELPQLLEQVQRSRRIAASTVALFCGDVLAHHAEEERELFPAVQAILERDGNHLRAVGLALHMSRMPELPGYI